MAIVLFESIWMDNWYKIAKELTDEDFQKLTKSKWELVDSSFIAEMAYYELAKVLEVRLKSGNKYTFMNVPKRIYEQFKNSPSKGKFFNDTIRKNYVLK